jgi:hypothetical protein
MLPDVFCKLGNGDLVLADDGPRVIDENIDVTIMPSHLLDQLLDLVRLAQVTWAGEAASPQRLDLLGHTVESPPFEPYLSRREVLRLAMDIRQGQVRTLLCQLQGCGAADTAHPTGPCNQGNFAIQSRHASPPSSHLRRPPRVIASNGSGTVL